MTGERFFWFTDYLAELLNSSFDRANLTPSTLHPAPYTLNHTPRTLQPIPFTINPLNSQPLTINPDP